MPLLRAELQRPRHFLRSALIHDVSQRLYLPFDHDDGSHARDRSGHVNHGTIYGATLTRGKIGQARQFDGIDNRIVVPNSATLKSFSEMTVLCWSKQTGITGTGRYLFDGGYWSAPYGYIAYAAGTTNRIQVYLKNTAGEGLMLTYIAFTPDEWIFWGWTWDGSLAYSIKNGVFQTGVAFSGLIDPTVDLWLGAHAPDIEWYDGIMDEVRIFNRALSEAEVRRVMYLRGI